MIGDVGRTGDQRRRDGRHLVDHRDVLRGRIGAAGRVIVVRVGDGDVADEATREEVPVSLEELHSRPGPAIRAIGRSATREREVCLAGIHQCVQERVEGHDRWILYLQEERIVHRAGEPGGIAVPDVIVEARPLRRGVERDVVIGAVGQRALDVHGSAVCTEHIAVAIDVGGTVRRELHIHRQGAIDAASLHIHPVAQVMLLVGVRNVHDTIGDLVAAPHGVRVGEHLDRVR